MKKYMLISVIDREIYAEQFDTHEEAYNQMIAEMNEAQAYGISDDERIAPRNSTEGMDNGAYGYHMYGGYLNDGVNHGDYDWCIVCISV